MPHIEPEVRPGLLDAPETVTEHTQVSDDKGAVAEQVGEELPIGQTSDGTVRPVAKAVEWVDHVGLDQPRQHPRDGEHDQQPEDHEAPERHRRQNQHVGVERPCRQGQRTTVEERGHLRELQKKHDQSAGRQR